MTITRVGSNEKYSTGWETAFGKGKAAKKASSSTDKSPQVKKGAKKVAAKAKATKAVTSDKSATKKKAPAKKKR